MKKWQKTISTGEKLDKISQLEKGEQMVHIRHNVKFTRSSVHTIYDNADKITEIAKSWPECLCSKSTTVIPEWTIPKLCLLSLLHFYHIRNKYIYFIHIQFTYTLQVLTSASGVVIHYIGWGCQTPNPRKYTSLNGNFVFNVHIVFQEHICGVKWDLYVLTFGVASKRRAGWIILDMIGMIFSAEFHEYMN